MVTMAWCTLGNFNFLKSFIYFIQLWGNLTEGQGLIFKRKAPKKQSRSAKQTSTEKNIKNINEGADFQIIWLVTCESWG